MICASDEEEDASDLKDPISDEDPEAESSGLDYDNRKENQYMPRWNSNVPNPPFSPTIKPSSWWPHIVHPAYISWPTPHPRTPDECKSKPMEMMQCVILVNALVITEITPPPTPTSYRLHTAISHLYPNLSLLSFFFFLDLLKRWWHVVKPKNDTWRNAKLRNEGWWWLVKEW